MFAIVDIAGTQEKVEKGMKLKVPSLAAKAGDSVTFDRVMLVSKSESDVSLGKPYVAGATVTAKVMNHGRADKIRVLKFKRRKRYLKVQGHRQGFSEIEVSEING